MKQSRDKLNERILVLLSKTSNRQEFFTEIEAKYNIPISLSSDICANRADISEFNDFIAFAVLDTLSHKEISKYFTAEEIKVLSNQKYITETFELPLVFENMVEITPDQWIGKITAKELMHLKDSQVIKYNENTQRTMQRAVHGENRYYKIALNQKSVGEIKDALQRGAYISDDITLNMPVETTEFEYVNGSIVIKELDKLDIIDGYHRYIGISRLTLEDPDFDYPMELRLVSFPEEKAKQLIYQKDQKTKMRQIDSRAMNQYNPANIVVDQLNTDPSSNIQGMIARNDGKSNYGELSAMIDYYWFRGKGKVSRKDILTVKKEIQDKFNSLTALDLDWTTQQHGIKEMQVIMYCFANQDDYIKSISKLLPKVDDIDSAEFAIVNGRVRRKLINDFEKRLGGR